MLKVPTSDRLKNVRDFKGLRGHSDIFGLRFAVGDFHQQRQRWRFSSVDRNKLELK